MMSKRRDEPGKTLYLICFLCERKATLLTIYPFPCVVCGVCVTDLLIIATHVCMNVCTLLESTIRMPVGNAETQGRSIYAGRDVWRQNN